MSAEYAILLDLRDRPVVVIGGGAVALRRVPPLVEAGARVKVVAPSLDPELASLDRQGRIQCVVRGATPEDCQGAFLVLLTSDQPGLHDSLQSYCRSQGILFNRADRPGAGDFVVPARARSGSISAWISTQGRSPKLARRLRENLEGYLSRGWPEALERLARLRREVQEVVPEPRRRSRFWRGFPTSRAWEALEAADWETWNQEVERCLSSPSE